MLLPPSANGGSVDLGQVGEVESIDPSVIEALEGGGFIPVVAPIGTGADGSTYNINADLVAGKLAEILKAEKLVVLTNTPGVLDKNGKLLTGLTPKKIDDLVEKGVISGGMIPKIGSALDAARNGVKSVHIIDGRVPHALLLEVLTDEGVGTLIRSKERTCENLEGAAFPAGVGLRPRQYAARCAGAHLPVDARADQRVPEAPLRGRRRRRERHAAELLAALRHDVERPDAPSRHPAARFPRRDARISGTRRHGGGRERPQARARPARRQEARVLQCAASLRRAGAACSWREAFIRRGLHHQKHPLSRQPSPPAFPCPAAQARSGPAPLRLRRRHSREPANRAPPGHVHSLGKPPQAARTLRRPESRLGRRIHATGIPSIESARPPYPSNAPRQKRTPARNSESSRAAPPGADM